MSQVLVQLVLLVLAYFLGSCPCAVVVCKLLKKDDPRSSGSNNPGSTNVLRIGGRLAGLLTLLGDAGKGLLPLLISVRFLNLQDLSGYLLFAAVLGHVYPFFNPKSGGKGVATFLGGLIAFAPLGALAFSVSWLLIALVLRYVSLASLLALLVSTGIVIFQNFSLMLPLSLILVMIVWRHRTNIERLWQGKERRLKF